MYQAILLKATFMSHVHVGTKLYYIEMMTLHTYSVKSVCGSSWPSSWIYPIFTACILASSPGPFPAFQCCTGPGEEAYSV